MAVNPGEEPLEGVNQEGECWVEGLLEEGLLEGELQEEQPQEEELLEVEPLGEAPLVEGDPVEEVLGPMGLEGDPREVLVDHVDPSPPLLHVLHTSAATLHLPSSQQGPSDEEDHHRGKDPSLADPILGDPMGPSLVGAHVVPNTQVVVGHEVPSLQEEGANRLDSPSLDEGGPNLDVADPSLDEGLWGPWEDILDLNALLRWAQPFVSRTVNNRFHEKIQS